MGFTVQYVNGKESEFS